MKPSALCAVSLATLIANAMAGPAVSSGPAQPDTDGAVYAPTTLQATSGLSPGANANNSTASFSGGSGGSNSTASASSSGASTGVANSNSGHSASNFSAPTAPGVNSSGATELKNEKVAEVSRETLAVETAKTREKSELSKKFDSSLLDQAVDIASPQAASKKPDSEGNKSTGAGSLNAQTNEHRLGNSSSQDDH